MRVRDQGFNNAIFTFMVIPLREYRLHAVSAGRDVFLHPLI